jgi:hypothetical protein
LADIRTKIQEAVHWGNPIPDFAYRLRDNYNDVLWFNYYLTNWNNYTKYSLKCIDEGCSHVVIADIAGYYELIDLYTLHSDLNGLGVKEDSLNLLFLCLNRWAQAHDRGIPQGYSASDILGKLYLNAVDRSLDGDGFKFCRYVDDYRIFCKSIDEARKALLLLIKKLRRRGLVIQAEKTTILSSDEARKQFEEVNKILNEVKDELIDKIIDLTTIDKASLTMEDIDTLLNKFDSDKLPVELLEDTYKKYFVDTHNNFNKTLFRFLLKRLGSASDKYALEHALKLLKDHPEETDAILYYITDIGEVSSADKIFINLFHSKDTLYQYQAYQIINWRRSQQEKPTEKLIALIRKFALKEKVEFFLRAEARAALGEFGSPNDLESLMYEYDNASSDIEKAEIICSIVKMETGRRNGFLGRVAGDSDICSRAVRYVRNIIIDKD